MLLDVQSGLLLLVDADRRAQRGITRVATELGMEVVACDSARAGLNAACALEPAAIVTELELPDFDGYWFVAQIRQQPTEVAASPILVVTHEIDTSSRAGTLKAGADVFLQKPIAPADLLAQARALIDMAQRMKERRPPIAAHPGAGAPGLLPAPVAATAIASPYLLPPSGGIDRFPAATVLLALELERRSGKLTLRPPGAVGPPIEADIASGIVLGGRVQGRALDPLGVVRAALALHDGYFEFVPGPDRPAPPTADFTGKLMSLAAEAPPPRSRRPQAGPSGPPRADTAAPPPSDEIVEKAFAKALKQATKPPPAKGATARPSKPPKSPTVRPAPVKVPPARVPAFAPPPPVKPPLAKPAVPPPPPRPAALGHSSAAAPPTRAASASADAKKKAPERPAPLAKRTVPPQRPDAEDEDVIEAENDG